MCVTENQQLAMDLGGLSTKQNPSGLWWVKPPSTLPCVSLKKDDTESFQEHLIYPPPLEEKMKMNTIHFRMKARKKGRVKTTMLCETSHLLPPPPLCAFLGGVHHERHIWSTSV